MHKALSGAALLTLIALPAQAEPRNVTYEFRLLSETERQANGTVGGWWRSRSKRFSPP
jgi:hypothetical protein